MTKQEIDKRLPEAIYKIEQSITDPHLTQAQIIIGEIRDVLKSRVILTKEQARHIRHVVTSSWNECYDCSLIRDEIDRQLEGNKK